MMGIEEYIFTAILSLITNAVTSTTRLEKSDFFTKRKVKARLENATAEVVQPLLPFLEQEGVDERQQRILVEACKRALKPTTLNSKPLFESSLDGEKLYKKLYPDQEDLPQEIREEGLASIYYLLFTRIATLLCRIPAAVKDWERNAWAENFQRLDELVTYIRSLFEKLDKQETTRIEREDNILRLARKTLRQSVVLKLDLHGLRGDNVCQGSLRDFFVHPELVSERKEERFCVGDETQAIEHFLNMSECAIVYGAPGSGKSTWSYWLQQEALTEKWSGLLLRCELRGLDAEKKLPSIHDMIRNSLTHIAEDIGPELLREWIARKMVALVLDGFDEIKGEAREDVLNWIKGLRITLENCSLIVTSRPLTTDHLDTLPCEWARWTIQPFDEDRIVDYIERWHKNTPLSIEGGRETNAQEIASQWRNDPTVEPLTSNPLLLSTLLMVHHLDGKLPNGRAALYRRYVDGMLGLWDDRRKITATTLQMELAQKRQILRALAIYMQFAQKDQIEEEEAASVVEKELEELSINPKPESIDVLAMLCERSGLIVGPGVYSFTHKSIGEYLVAETIHEGDRRDAEGTRLDRLWLFEQREKDRWNVVTFLWAGLATVRDVEDFVDSCSNAGCDDLAYGLLYDQWDKFPREFRRRHMLRYLAGESTLGKVNSFSKAILRVDSRYPIIQIVNYSVLLGSLNRAIKDLTYSPYLPYYIICGLSSDVSFYQLLVCSFSEKILRWSDVKFSTDETRNQLWMAIALEGIESEEWQEVLEASPPPNHGVLWHLVIAHRLLKFCARHEQNSKEKLKVFAKICPWVSPYLPICVLDELRYGMVNIIRSNTKAFQLIYSNLSFCIDILRELGLNRSNRVLLQSTFYMNIFRITKIEPMIVIREAIQSTQASTAEESAKQSNVLAFIDDLIEQRGEPIGTKEDRQEAAKQWLKENGWQEPTKDAKQVLFE